MRTSERASAIAAASSESARGGAIGSAHAQTRPLARVWGNVFDPATVYAAPPEVCCVATVYTPASCVGALCAGPPKGRGNLRVRDFDFEFATLVFEGPTLEREDQRRDYGETRIIAIGLAQGISITVVYTDRAEAGRLAQGPRYQSRMNAVLRAYMSAIEKGAA